MALVHTARKRFLVPLNIEKIDIVFLLEQLYFIQIYVNMNNSFPGAILS